MSSRITDKERNLIKGALRRVFSRSELRQKVIAKSVIPNYFDPNRKRVKKWSICPVCQKHTPTYQMQADHVIPLIPLDKTLKDLSWDEIVDRLWCKESNLQATCISCHKIKSKAENKERRLFQKQRKKMLNK